MNPDEIEEERRVPMSAERCATPTTHYIEAEADIFGLNAAREPDGFATVSLKLGEYRETEPGSSRRDYPLRPSEWPLAHSHGDDLENGTGREPVTFLPGGSGDASRVAPHRRSS